MADFAANYPNDPVDVIMGDWMSEANMTSRAASKTASQAVTGGFDIPSNSSKRPSDGTAAYEPTFLEALEPALVNIAKHGIKLAANAGASDTELLHNVVKKMVKDKGLDLKVAWISGDEVLPAVKQAQAGKRSKFENICTGELLEDWKFEPVSSVTAFVIGLSYSGD